MRDDLNKRNLQDLFVTDTWQDCFSALTESLGFTLSIFSRDGNMLYSPCRSAPFCHRLRSSAPGLITACDLHCVPFLKNALKTGKPNVFKCHLKVVSFAIPVHHKEEAAIILGQGSCSSLEDFYEGKKRLQDAGIDVASMTEPTVFTSYAKAWMVCDFTADAVRMLLRRNPENHVDGSDSDKLKKFIRGWGVPKGEEPEVLYRRLLQELPSLIPIDGSAVFVRDGKQQRYVSLSSLCGDGSEQNPVSLCEAGDIVQGLLAGKPYVLSADSETAAEAETLKGMSALHFFPIIVHSRLDGILCIADRAFKTSDSPIVVALCRQTALSLENNQLRQELFRKFDRFIALSELTKSITPIQNYQMLMKKILDESAGLLTAEQGSLMLIDSETDDLLLSAKKGTVEGMTGQLRIRSGDGIAGKVAESGDALLVANLEDDHRIRQKNREHYKTRSFVSIPLKIGTRVIGVINLSDKATGEVFNEEDLKLIQAFATHAAIVMDRNVSLNKAAELEKLATTDPLTGLANRRYLFERLHEELARSERHGHHLSLLMIDLDGFKRYNDTQGHLFGDEVLKDVALIITNTIRSIDFASRYGGDEFIVYLPETDEELAKDIAERMRSNVEKRIGVPLKDGERREQDTPTVSIGIACYPSHGATTEQLINNVDTAMYQSKKQGKNRIAVFQANLTTPGTD